MDIKKFAVQPTSRLHLRDANDELMYADETISVQRIEEPEPTQVHGSKTKPIAVNLFGPGSKQYARAFNEKQNHDVDLLKKKGKTKESAEEARGSNAQFLSACTASWENMEYDELTGDELSIAVYSDVSIGFIADQVAAHLRDWGNFTKGSTKP